MTQNTSWTSVEKALLNLKALNALDNKLIQKISVEQLKSAIRPAGYFNQKAKKLLAFSKFFSELDGRVPSRDELLSIWGIGNETADSMLLYAFKTPVFVVDAYTKRIFSRIGLIKSEKYEEIKMFFQKNLPKNTKLYQEYHALIVEHAKKICKKEPECEGCPLLNMCLFGKTQRH